MLVATPMRTLGNYILGKQLGTGSMGAVYAAVHRHGALVAVKVLHRELLSSRHAVQRFRDEAIAGQIVTHPHLVSIIDFGEADDVPYLVMRRVAGPSLGKLLRVAGGLPRVRALPIVVQILEALQALHDAGIVHGDVKSDNVLVHRTNDGSDAATLIDLGLARVELASEALAAGPATGLVAGTPDYMAPEITRGHAPSITSDLYAAGVILYELLTGTPPFAGGTAVEIIWRQARDTVVSPSLRCPDLAIPAILDTIALRALAKEPTQRFRSARAFAAALQSAVPCVDASPALRPQRRSLDDAATVPWHRGVDSTVLAT